MLKKNKNIILSVLALLALVPLVVLAQLYVSVLPVTQKNLTSATIVGVLTDDELPAGVSTHYVKFKYTKTTTTSCENMANATETAVQSINVDFQLHEFYNFQQQISNLTPHTKYYFCAVRSSEQDFSSNVQYSSVRDFTTELPPSLVDSVVTGDASGITENSATIYGEVLNTGHNEPIFGKFKYSENYAASCASLPNAKNTPVQPPGGTGATMSLNLSQKLVNLKSAKKYYYCAVGDTNSDFPNAIYGEVKSFTTLPSNSGNSEEIGPVTTKDYTQLDDNEVTLQGNYSGGAPGYAYFRFTDSKIPPVFCNDIYGSDMIGVTANNPDPIGYMTTDGGDFSVHVDGLEPETTYYYCAIVSNDALVTKLNKLTYKPQIKYGTVKSFRTLPCLTCNLTTVVTESSKVLDSQSVNLKGSYKSSKPVKLYFEYSKTFDIDNPPASGSAWKPTNPPKLAGFNSYGEYTFLLNGLEKNTEYSFRAVGQMSSGEIVYGSTIKFTTDKYDGVGPIKTLGDPTDDNTLDPNGSTDDGDDSGNDNCPAGTVGTYPDCTPGDTQCPAGYEGTPPNCINPAGGGGGDKPTVTVTASPVFIDSGESSTVTWSSTNATSCVLNGYDVPTSGAADTGALENSRSYSVVCTGPGGSASDDAQVYVNISGGNGGGNIVSVQVNVQPVFGALNSFATVSWTSSGAEFCDSSGHGTGTSGSFSVGPITESSSHTISCSGESGTASATGHIFVKPDINTPSCVPHPETQSLTCPSGQVGAIIQLRTSTCPDPNGSPVWSNWNEITNSCQTPPGGNGTQSCVPHPETQPVACPSGQVGTKIQLRNSTCPNGASGAPVWSNWQEIVNSCQVPPGGSGNANCVAHPETTSGTCPSGQVGTIINLRNSTCPNGASGAPVWSNWQEIVNSCQAPGGNGLPPVCIPHPETTTESCPAGKSGIIMKLRDSTCPNGASGAPVWSNWQEIVNSCQAPGGNNGGGGAGSWPPGPGNPWSPTGPGGPGDPNGNGGNNPTLPQGPDNDGDGLGNPNDDDTDGDWDPNGTDTDDDGDGVPDLVDATPNGPGTSDDLDGNGVNNNNDNDIDGDGVPNYLDNDTDADGIPNALDNDDDGDGVPDWLDLLPKGPHGDRVGNVLGVGDTATPPSDAIVHYHEGIETVFARQIRNRTKLAEKLGYSNGENLEFFSQNMAHTLARFYFGYIDENGREVRVSVPDVSAYELRIAGNKLAVYEYYRNKIIDIRVQSIQFKNKNPYEYYFHKKF